MNCESTCWVARPGKGAGAIELFLQEGVVAVGWGSIGDLSGVSDRRGVRARVEQGPHGYDTRRVGSVAGVLLRIRSTIEIGDVVVSPDKVTGMVHVGVVTSGYFYRPGQEMGHCRGVDWRASVNRNSLSEECRRALGGRQTLYALRSEAWTEILPFAES